jgi:hypothetical protein
MNDLIEKVKECLAKGGDLSDTLTMIWLDEEKKGHDLSNGELNALVIEAVKEMN